MLRATAAALLLLALALASPALAETPRVQVAPEAPLAEPVTVLPGQAFALNFTVASQVEERLLVLVAATGPPGWNVTVLPEGFELPNASEGVVRSFRLTVLPPGDARPGDFGLDVQVSAANAATEVGRVHLPIALAITHHALVLGLWENPLPPPVDNAYGVFLLDVLFWGLIAIVLIGAQDRIVAWLTRHAEKNVSARIVRDLRKPMFFALVFFGFTQSWAALPPGWWVDLGHRILAAATILVTMYVVYKLFRAVLTYYVENISARTESTLDDILVPVLEKVGAVVIVVAGLLYFIGTLGIDLGAFIAGGVVVSMVLAFAAQDTLSNFFAGLFLMLDRPFGRGDDIMLVTGGPLTGDVFRVDHVGLRSTRLYHYKNHQLVVMPNNDLAKNPIVNLMYPDQRWRVHLPVQTNYGVDVDKVQDLLQKAAAAHPMVESGPGFEPFAALDGFGESGLNFILLFFVKDVKKRGLTASDVRERILKDFAANGIYIPYPQREVRLLGEGGPGGPGPAPAGGRSKLAAMKASPHQEPPGDTP